MDLQTAVRIETGDNDPERGIMPGAQQVNNEMFTYAAAWEQVTEFDNPTEIQIGQVAAKILELAARAWATQPVSSVTGPAEEMNRTRVNLEANARRLRAAYGWGNQTNETQTRPNRAPNYASHGVYAVPPGAEDS